MNFVKKFVVLSLIAGSFLDATPHPLESKKTFDLNLDLKNNRLEIQFREEPSEWGKFFGFQPAVYKATGLDLVPPFSYLNSMSVTRGTLKKISGDEPSGILALICCCIRATQDRDR